MEDSNNKLDDLLSSGKVDKAMQMAFALLSTAEGTNDSHTNSVRNDSFINIGDEHWQ